MSKKPAPLKTRFEKYVIRSRECWLWAGSTKSNFGYGIFNVDNSCKKAHRVSYELYVGPIPPGLCVLHRCDNPPCVRPSHLFIGMRKDNVDDMMRKNRYGKVRNSKLTPQQVKEIKNLANKSGKEIALEYRISEGLVSMIRRGHRWRKI